MWHWESNRLSLSLYVCPPSLVPLSLSSLSLCSSLSPPSLSLCSSLFLSHSLSSLTLSPLPLSLSVRLPPSLSVPLSVSLTLSPPPLSVPLSPPSLFLCLSPTLSPLSLSPRPLFTQRAYNKIYEPSLWAHPHATWLKIFAMNQCYLFSRPIHISPDDDDKRDVE